MGATVPTEATKGESRGAAALAKIQEHKLRWVELFYTDLLGGYNHVHVPAHTLDEDSFTTGIPKLDGSSVKGFREIYESDMILRPDPATFGIMPWGAEYGGTARFICDIHLGVTREPYSHDPRGIAYRAQQVLAKAGFDRSYWGPEIEFFVFDRVRLLPSANAVRDAWGGAGYEIVSEEAPWNLADGHGSVRFKEGYHRSGPSDALEGMRSEVSNILTDSFHIRMDAHHHEVATAGQGEINIRFDDMIPAADHVQDVRFILKSVAGRHGKVASFMPKPVFGDNGIGMHMNQSIWSAGVNAFYDANDPYAEVSQVCRYYVGGLLEHARALCAITNPTTNSYRRLVPGYEAPVFIAWSRANRSANVRIPYYLKGRPEAKRIEYRTPDSAANIYLTEAALALAGLDGIRRKIEPPPPVDTNIYKLSPAKRRELGVRELPGSLGESLACLDSDSEFLKPAFEASVLDVYRELKHEEQLQLNLRPHPWEFYQYLDV
ncbi:MAG: type I glutamate--ammonia ligase [Thermoplasmata archaeon]|nr:type I glutamate--ammonia ligase [Thermoplasmata archaeon]MCI4359632.1 type I glutamate--ammonia ligase [Thermoplasmata archaeon]